jgi:hypothetical protein
MTEQESNIMAEYMAGVVLKHSGYKETLVYPESKKTLDVQEVNSGLDTGSTQAPTTPTTPTTSPAQSPTTSETLAENQNPTKDPITQLESFNDLIKNKDFDVKYADFALLDKYPSKSSDYFDLEPNSGNKLFVVKFNVTNLSDKTKIFNLIDQSLNYKLDNNSGNSYAPMKTLLTNDLQFINVNIAAGDSYNAVVVFEVPKDIDITKINLNISKADKTTTIAMN